MDKEQYEEMLEQRRVKKMQEKLREFVEKNGGVFIVNQLVDHYNYLVKAKLESIQDKTPIHEDDVMGFHVLVQRLFTPAFAEQNKHNREEEKQSIALQELPETSYDEFAAYLYYEGDLALSFFYGDGEVYSFNHYDGMIDPEFVWIEKEGYVDVYIYMAYIGK